MSESPKNFFNPDRNDGRVLPPLILWLLGVPGGIAILLWLLIFRGH